MYIHSGGKLLFFPCRFRNFAHLQKEMSKKFYRMCILNHGEAMKEETAQEKACYKFRFSG